MRPQLPWSQAVLHLTDYTTAEHLAVHRLRPLMTTAEHNNDITAWWFIRKAPTWRIRWLPTRPNGDPVVHHALDDLRDTGLLAGWTMTIYEPETHAFGGEPAMDLAHTLFHHDSHHILDHLARTPEPDQRHELTILLCATLMRGAGLDWYEQGDTWARVAHNRLNTDPISHDTTAMRRLLIADTTPNSPKPRNALNQISGWISTFYTAGEHLGRLSRTGKLHRGLRAVLAHHILFHWNRLGVNYRNQHRLANTATTTILDGLTSPKCRSRSTSRTRR
ncbi:O-methyltransferase clustered with LanBC [Alloactinosynnema sp. L-07]|uniref:thiopeptide-type bacteriocin biosynthesis protein n=1 Tax=Alloactinosynnema sp. L-07 TaxID=1653480 RepID=UPI00065EF5F9|nr:thiopeptide-type bacteriocin biosynthesis protein [Alloactinosynnema sp. L-07]CRK59227.1 O-methyltransferase clustered with LanBC [Alloactinosynnema sp. L-07]